ncbi:hypothetical protein BDR06DRAFT_958811 [Suillus hirtellus]|nr:hypothetical protein BDR06DRAFT_958811 [Suillus hirtellus]
MKSDTNYRQERSLRITCRSQSSCSQDFRHSLFINSVVHIIIIFVVTLGGSSGMLHPKHAHDSIDMCLGLLERRRCAKRINACRELKDQFTGSEEIE